MSDNTTHPAYSKYDNVKQLPQPQPYNFITAENFIITKECKILWNFDPSNFDSVLEYLDIIPSAK